MWVEVWVFTTPHILPPAASLDEAHRARLCQCLPSYFRFSGLELRAFGALGYVSAPLPGVRDGGFRGFGMFGASFPFQARLLEFTLKP